MKLPEFCYHPDPLRSGSVEPSAVKCRACGQAPGYIYVGPVYAEEDLSRQLCPWCIHTGKAHKQFAATFTDDEALADGIPAKAAREITTHTPGFNSWQGGHWAACCGDGAAFLSPMGIAEIRAGFRELEGEIMSHIVHEMQISGGAAVRLLESLRRDQSPTLYLFQCRKCPRYHFHIDSL